MSEITDHDITAAMIRYGGSFVSKLGELYRYADPDNQRRLRDTFPEYWASYRAMVLLRRSDAAATPST